MLVREELAYSFDVAGEVGRRVLLQLFLSILVFFILMIAVYELGGKYPVLQKLNTTVL